MMFKKLKKFTITPFYVSLRKAGKITPDGHIKGEYIIGVDAISGDDSSGYTIMSANTVVRNMREIRDETIRRWESLGLFESLTGKADAVAELFENQRTYLINEPEEFAPRQSMASRYANKMVDARYYQKIVVPIGVSSRGFGIQFKTLRKMPFGTKYAIGGAWNEETNAFDKVAFPIVRRVFR